MEGTDARSELLALLRQGDENFWPRLLAATRDCSSAVDALSLATFRRKAQARGMADPIGRTPLRLAIVGGYSLYPLRELVAHALWANGYSSTDSLFIGDYDNYVHELGDEQSELCRFRPEVIVFIPAERRCVFSGKITDGRQPAEEQARALVSQLIGLCSAAHERTGAEIVLTNFLLPARFDPGAFRTRSLTSPWSFRKLVNLELGLAAPPFVHLCDLEFLAYRRGGIEASDARLWFDSKQLCTPDMMLDLGKEVAHLVRGLRVPPKKLLALDLDDTLWGGTVGDLGTNGIELGDTSPRGEAFKAFQTFVASLKERGVLLAVCSKNDHDKAADPFKHHPDMVLRLPDLVGFKANWEPKSENLKQLARELSLGLDSFVFVDDNPAEIDIVQQYAPGVTALWLGPDPAEYVNVLQDARLFEPLRITAEDAQRTDQYRREGERQQVLASATDMDAYLTSLQMRAHVQAFAAVDVPRISQLINKSNQFNLTTRRRSESEVQAVMNDPAHRGFTIRLVDRFGDHGLIAVVIGRVDQAVFEIDTWLMSCRVLKRQVEEETVNEIVRLATAASCTKVVGRYLATEKNGMVKDLYPRMGFEGVEITDGYGVYVLDPRAFCPRPTHIAIVRAATG